MTFELMNSKTVGWLHPEHHRGEPGFTEALFLAPHSRSPVLIPYVVFLNLWETVVFL